MTKFLFEVICDNGGVYEFPKTETHDSYLAALDSAIADRNELRATEWGEDFFCEDCPNVEDSEFEDAIEDYGYAVMCDSTGNNSRIYRITAI